MKKEELKINNRKKLLILSRISITLFLILFSIYFILAESSTAVVKTQYFSPSTTNMFDSTYSSLISGPSASSSDTNRDYFDLAVMIPPAGCSPYVVRSDLLEEQNVPVFCQLIPIKVNPGIDITRIERVSIKQVSSNDYISGIGFHPANAAIRSQSNSVSNPTSDNLGYVVVVLKKQPNEKEMPENITATLALSLEYGADYAFGIGANEFYVPALDDSQFANLMSDYSFFDGLGYLRVEDIDDKGALVSVYDSYGKSQAGVRKVFSDRVEVGKTSRDFYLYSSTGGQGLRFNLKDITIPETIAKIKADGRIFDVYKGGKFFDGKCTLNDVQAYTGGTGYVQVNCGSKPITLEKNFNKVNLQIGSTNSEENLIIGQEIKGLSDSVNSYYLAYAGQVTPESYSFIIVLKLNINEAIKYSDSDLKQKIIDLSKNIDGVIVDSSTRIISKSKLDAYINSYKASPFGFSSSASLIELHPEFESDGKTLKSQKIDGKFVVFSKLKAEDVGLNDNDLRTYFDNALRDFDYVKDGFGAETCLSRLCGESALWAEYDLAKELHQDSKANTILSRLENDYPLSLHNGLSAHAYLSNNQMLSSEDSAQYDEKNNIYLELVSVNAPSNADAGVQLHVNNEVKILNKKGVILSYPEKAQYVVLDDFDENGITVSYECKTNPSDSASKKGTVKGNMKFYIQDCNANIVVDKINLKKVAHIEIVPNVRGRSKESNFTFSIGIEKRAFMMNLTPKEADNKIKELQKQIDNLKNITDNLGKFIKAEKLACLATTGVINLMNLVSGASGEATARQAVMKKWNAYCADSSHRNSGETAEDCIARQYESKIKPEIEQSTTIMNSYNKIYDAESKSAVNKDKSGRVNDTKVREKIRAAVVTSLNNNLQFYDDKGQKIDCKTPYNQTSTITCQSYAQQILDSKNLDDLSYNDLSDLYFSLRMAQAGLSTSNGYSSSAYSQLRKIEAITESKFDINSQLSGTGGLTFDNVDTVIKQKDSFEIDYTGKKFKDLPSETKNIITSSNSAGVDPLARISTVIIGGGTYLYVFEGTERNLNPKEIYDIKNKKLLYNGADISGLTNEQKALAEKLKNVKINIRDSLAYKNKCKNCDYAKVFITEPYKGMPSLLPFDCNEGWYVQTKQDFPGLGTGNVKTFQDSGRVNSFYLCNVGSNGLMEGVSMGDDICSRFDMYTQNNLDTFGGLTQEQAKSIISRAIKSIEDAQSKLTTNPTSISVGSCPNLKVKESEGDIGSKCTDFMSPKQCQMIFNVCDPVICPNSRCDFGGTYKVNNVIQSGIIGSTFLCLPNFIGLHPDTGVIIPVCLTGINAGLEGWTSILESYRDCINESVTNNRTVGICDAVYSVYVCDFFWKQAGPIVQALTKNLFYAFFGKGDHGGGEYLFVNDAWNNAEKSVQYFQTTYGKDSNLKFGFNDISNVVSDQVCKMSASASYPDNFDAMLEPESPVQFHAFFDESIYTSATVPARSQYKVTYIIYGGKESGHSYQIYLKSSPTSLGYAGKDSSIVASGYIPKGGRVSESKDFIDVSGFKELCVRIDLKEECGFKSVSTSALLDYAQDKAVASQAKEGITSESECIAGSSSLGSLLTPNVQQAAEEALNPEIYNRGIVRVCANQQPAINVDPARWKDVGYCGDRNMRCWIDTQSVKKAIKGTYIENQTLEEINNLSIKNLIDIGGYLPADVVISKINELKLIYIDNIGGVVGSITSDNKKGKYSGSIENYKGATMDNLDEYVRLLDKVLILSSHRALLFFTRAEIYNAAARKLKEVSAVATSTSDKKSESPVILKISTPIVTYDSASKKLQLNSDSGSFSFTNSNNILEYGFDRIGTISPTGIITIQSNLLIAAKVRDSDSKIIMDNLNGKNINTFPKPGEIDSSSIDKNSDQYVLALMIYGEERDQGEEAMKAAGWVAVNRLNAKFDGKTKLIDIIKEPKQFKGYQEVKDLDTSKLSGSEKTAWELALRISGEILAPFAKNSYSGYLYFGNDVSSDAVKVSQKMRACVPKISYKRIGLTTMYISKEDYTGSNCNPSVV